MKSFILIGAGLALGIYGICYLWSRYGKAELAKILVSVEGLVTKLEEFVADKELQITNHVEEIALHNRHVNAKRADSERAKRVQARLAELLQ